MYRALSMRTVDVFNLSRKYKVQDGAQMVINALKDLSFKMNSYLLRHLVLHMLKVLCKVQPRVRLIIIKLKIAL